MENNKILEFALAYGVSIAAVLFLATSIRPIMDDLADWFMEQEEKESDL